MKKNITVKIFAFLALFGIVISVIGTGLMIFIGGGNEQVQEEKSLTQEDLQKMIDDGKFEISNSGVTNGTGEISGTGEIK